MTPIQLDIIRTFGSKELSEGCLINTDKGIKNLDDHFIIGTDNKLYRESRNGNEPYLYSQTCETLGHIPELFPDVARVAEEKGFSIWVVERKGVWYMSIGKIDNPNIVINPKFIPHIPLLDQPEETLVQLLTLFK